MRKKHWAIFFGALSCWNVAARADLGDFNVMLNADGLGVVANQLKESVLDSVKNKPLPDIDQTITLGINLHATDIKFSADFDDFKIVPQNAGLALSIGVRNATIDIGRMRISKKIIYELSTTCEHTVVNIGRRLTLPFKATLSGVVDGGTIRTAFSNVIFEVPDSEFGVVGPTRCSGAIGIGDIIKEVVHSVLAKSSGTIADGITHAIYAQGPTVGKIFQDIATQHLDVGAITFPGLPQLQGSIQTQPYSLAIDGTGVTFGLSVTAASSKAQAGPRPRKHLLLDLPIKFGEISLKSMMINQILENVVPWEKQSAILDHATHSELIPFLNRTFFSKVWPELAARNDLGDEVRIQVEMGTAPQILPGFDSLHLLGSISQLTFILQVQKAGHWEDYSRVRIGLNFGLDVEIYEDAMELNLENVAVTSIDPGATPGAFDESNFKSALVTVIHTMQKRSSFLSLAFPVLALGGKFIAPANPSYNNGMIKIEMVEAQ